MLLVHAMSDDRRKHPRAVAHMSVEMRARSFGDLAHDATSDLSTGGMFIKTERQLALDDVVEFRIVTEREMGVIEGQARVVRVTDEGVGVAFLDLEEPYRSMVDMLVALQLKSKQPA